MKEELLHRLVQSLLEKGPQDGLYRLFDLTQEGLFSDPSAKALHRARRMAHFLIDEKGDFDLERAEELLGMLKKHGYIFYPTGTHDGVLTEYQIGALERLIRLKGWWKRFRPPVCHRLAEDLVRNAVGVEGAITVSILRKAVLTACLTPLRQTVGSCFATAPAILIQREKIEIFLEDLYQLLTVGKLKRTFNGVEYAVPLTPNIGVGDSCKRAVHQNSLKNREFGKERHRNSDSERATIAQGQGASENTNFEVTSTSPKTDSSNCFGAHRGFELGAHHPLLKAWEFTLASLSEAKMEFSSWNLYTSLGLHHEAVGGIGEVIYRWTEEKLREINQKISEAEHEYNRSADQVRAVERLLSRAENASAARRFQAELQGVVYHMQTCLEQRDLLHAQGSRYSTLFSDLVKQYLLLFPIYFQETYDPTIRNLNTALYEDAPAGFRLMYKHGRPDPSVWTPIEDAKGYIESLVTFFNTTESQAASIFEWKGAGEVVSEVTSRVIDHLRDPVFLQTALKRVYDPSENRTPWAYTSGGSMHQLLNIYFRKTGRFTEESRWVESPSDLLIFMLDTLKNLPPKTTDGYLKDPGKGMLMSSPSHAFILHPGWKPFVEGWTGPGFTYTWVRDQVFLPNQRFYADMMLGAAEQQLLFDALNYQGSSIGSVSVIQWRSHMVEKVGKKSEEIDALLYRMLPIVPVAQGKIFLRHLFPGVWDEKMEAALREMPTAKEEVLSADTIRQMAEWVFLKVHERIDLSFDLHEKIAVQARLIGLAPPLVLRFADTNWVGNDFGFVVNPGTGNLELWRLDKSGTLGSSMDSWKQWLDGREKTPWILYVRPDEY